MWFFFTFRLDFRGGCGILVAVMKDKMVKLRGPNGTTKEITLDEWNSYTPLNRQAQRLKEMYEAAEAVGSTDGEVGGEIYDFGCEC